MSAAGPDEPPALSVVIPVRNDAANLMTLLDELTGAGVTVPEIVVVDGGSDDGSSARAAGRAGVRVIDALPGRGRQLAAGCAGSSGRWLWLLHADSRNVLSALEYLERLVNEPGGRCWGRFEVAFEPTSRGLAVVARAMAWRSRLSGICTGDQGIFVRRDALERIGGVPAQPLMEDIELSRRLKRLARPLCPRIALTTSSRRWQRDGLVRTILRMWWFRLRYWLGADPDLLARSYYR